MDNDSARGLRPRDPRILPDLVAGIGVRRAATADEINALLAQTLSAFGANEQRLALLVTRAVLVDHPALKAVAARLDLPLVGLPDDELRAGAPNPSAQVAALVGLASVAEAAALAYGPLLAPKHRSASATCALARRLYGEPMIRASAASTVAASTAGG